MPKITRFGGPTNAGLNQTEAGFVEPPLTPPADWIRPEDAEPEDVQDDAPKPGAKRSTKARGTSV